MPGEQSWELGRVRAARRPMLAAAFREPALLGLPAVLFVFAFSIWPIADFLRESLVADGQISLNQYQLLARSATFAVVMGRTLATAAIVTLACAVLAYPLAYALTKANGGWKWGLIGLVALPYLTSVIVRTYAWAAILSVEGPVNTALVSLGLVSQPLLLGHSDLGMRIGMVHILLPVAVLTLWAAIQKIDPMHRVVAESLGASKVEAFLTVSLAQSGAAFASVVSLVYILALGAYVVPATLGGTRGLLFAQMVVEQATSLLNWNLAAAMAVLMLVAAAAPPLVFGMARLTFRNMASSRSLGGLRSALSARVFALLNRIPEAFWTVAWRVAAAAVLLFLLLPELVVIAFSFGPERQISFPPAYLTLQGYRNTLTDPSWLDPLWRSVIYAAADAVLAAGLGALAAYGFARGRASLARIATMLLVVPVVLPEIVFAIGYFVFANRWGLSGTAIGIILGQAAATIGLVVIMLTAVVRQLDPSIEDAAAMCGASRMRTFVEIVLPVLAPGLAVALIYGFLHAFDNLVLPLFIAGTNATVPVRMFLSLQEELTSAPAVIASVLMGALAVALILTLRLARRTRLSGFIVEARI